jgi:hypothetical protein
MLEQSIEMSFFMRHLFSVGPRFFAIPCLDSACFPVCRPDTVNYLRPKRQSEWWCASRFSHGNFKYGAFLSAAISPLSRSAMSIVLLPPRQRITLVK